MCLNPLKIENRSLYYNPYLNRGYNVVPCGECPECVNVRRSDYATRAMSEMSKYVNAVMLLFTYAPCSVPVACYDGETFMCFNTDHIAEMIRILKRKFGDFSYLVGSEYGMDVLKTQRPHYHGLFMLPSYIDPSEFYDACVSIWTGLNYYEDDYQQFCWKYGNLGFVFPRKDDVSHEWLCKDLVASAKYCSKYCVKQTGFINKPVWQKILKNGDYHRFLSCRPRIFLNKGFGRNMLDNETFDPVKKTVVLFPNTPYAREVSVPSSVMDMYQYKRIWRGRKSYVVENGRLVWNKTACTLRMRRLYEREMKSDALISSLKRLEVFINKRNEKLVFLGLPSNVARYLSIYHYVYKSLPCSALFSVCNIGKSLYSLSFDEFFDKDVYSCVYRFSTLYKHIDFSSYDIQLMTYNRKLGVVDFIEDESLKEDFVYIYGYTDKILQDKAREIREQKRVTRDNAEKLRSLLLPHPL